MAAVVWLAAACSSGSAGPAPSATTGATTTTQAAATTVEATTEAPTTVATTTTLPSPQALCPQAVAPYPGLSQVIPPNPVVAADGTATFTFTDAAARSVRVTGTWDGTSGYPHTDTMRNDGAGTWTVTIGPLAPGSYRYVFEVNGQDTLDPLNPNGMAGLDKKSVFYVPGPGGEFVDPTAPVAHGTVRTITYRSGVTGRDRTAVVWTPPGYEASGTTYPTLYLVHGGGGDSRYWVSQAWGNIILDNLLAAGAIVPFVVVMPDANVPGTLDGPGGDTFPAELVDHLVPAVQQCFRVSGDASQRALAGLSNGGLQTWDVLLTRPGAFAYIGDMSSGYSSTVIRAIRRSGVLEANRDAINSLTVLHRVYVGDRTDMDHAANQATRALFDEYGIRYEFAGEYPAGHSYITWQHNLDDFARLLFR
jgi:enterochelin esterase-like enzyme